MTGVFPLAFAGLLATLSVALARAMATEPDPAVAFPKPLNMLIVAALGWTSIALNAAYSLFRFGLVLPGGIAVILYGIFHLARKRNLVPYYKFSIGFGVITALVTVLAMSQNINIRSS